jgi:serine/threonine protein kinase
VARLDLDADTWAQLNHLLDAALELPRDARATWLETLGPEVQSLVPQLRDLLSRAAAVETADFLRTLPSVVGVDPGRVGSAPAGASGQTVGAYRLVREIGSGGMGSVWLADRADGLFNRPVALKLPHLFGPQAALAERMAREREILATLDHPNIARLFDAGITAAGQPFLALEFIQGVPIDEFVRGKAGESLTTAATLRLFLQVVDAVAFAHGKLVIHRDLKPANLLVNANGEVRLLDFGIAKLLGHGQSAQTPLTLMAGGAMTPDYASPEQILGEPLGVATDVYSLGVILYELLTGSRPYRLQRDSRGALEDAILQAAPAPMPRELRGDVETIVQKALQKNPADRYATANAFAEDVERFLDRRPVLARPDSRLYRARRFFSRNRLAASAAAAVLVAIVSGAAIALWQTRVALVERDRAEEVKRFITSIFDDADPYRNGVGQTSGAALLRTAQARISTQFRSRPELRVELLTLVGASLKSLGDLPNAEIALRDAVAEASRVHGPGDVATVRARTQLADVFNTRRATTQLAAELEQLVPLARQVMSVDPRPLVQLLVYRADLDYETGNYADSQSHAREAFALAANKLGPEDPLAVRASNLLAETYLVADSTDAEMLADSARGLAFARAAFGARSHHPLLLQMRTVRARALGVAGQYREGIAEMASTLDALRTVLGPEDPGVANAMFSLASWERRVGDLVPAIHHTREGLAVLAKSTNRESADYGSGLTTLGTTLIAARQPAEAAQVLGQSEDFDSRLLGATHWDTLTARFNRAWALAYLGRHADARKLLASAGEPGVEMRYPMWFAYLQGATSRLAGDARAAVECERRAYALIDEGPKASWDRIRVSAELGLAELDAGNLDGAYESLQRMITLADQNRMSLHPAYAEALTGLGRVHLARGVPSLALPVLSRADAFWREFDADNPAAVDAARWLGKARLALAREEKKLP